MIEKLIKFLAFAALLQVGSLKKEFVKNENDSFSSTSRWFQHPTIAKMFQRIQNL
jgi:hypothetical protein